MKWLIVLNLIFSISLSSYAKVDKTSAGKSKSAVTTTTKKAKAKSSKIAKKSPKPSGKPLQKSISFSDRVVKGKRQVPGEGLVTVENEKPVFNLLSVRSDFNDRRELERQRD